MLTGAGGRTGLRSARGSRVAHDGRTGRRRGRRGAPGSRRGRRLAWAVALAVALAALFTLTLRQSLTAALTSDGAANILQAQAMLHGNPLLRGWWTSDVSFYTTELPEYALVLAVRGLSPDVAHICGALTYTLTVALAALLARGRAPGAAGLRRAGLAVAIMLAPSILGGTGALLENPNHFGTSAPVLLLFLLLDWGERRDLPPPGWAVAVAVAACALLAWTQVGDELSVVAATVPVAVVCALRVVSGVIRRRPPSCLRRDGLLLAAALISVALARIAERALRALGGFDKRPVAGGRLASLGQLPGNARLLWDSIVLLFGANNPGSPGRATTISRPVPLVAMADLHVIGLALAGAGLVAGIAAGFFGRIGRADPSAQPDRAYQAGEDRDRVNQILVVAIGATIAAAVFSTVMQSLANAHEVAILLPLGAVLAGRTLPPLARQLVQARAQRPQRAQRTQKALRAQWAQRSPAQPARLATVALAGWLAVGAAEAGYAATWPAAPVPVQNVAAWLVAHHERDGLAGYWQATVTTVASGGRVLVSPVTDAATAPKRWEASSAWYRPSRHRATFVIAQVRPPHPADSLTLATARARFGKPAAEYDLGGSIILIYRYNLLARLHDRAFPGAS
jgi:hypothetical protein